MKGIILGVGPDSLTGRCFDDARARWSPEEGRVVLAAPGQESMRLLPREAEALAYEILLTLAQR